MNDLIIHPQYESLSKEIHHLKDDVIMFRTRIDRISKIDIPYYQTLYYQYFGDLEQELYKKYYQYRLLKRKLEMIQASINQGKTPDMEAFEIFIAAETEEYESILKEKAEQIKEAKNKKYKTIDANDSIQIKKLYKEIVLALHPDVNPDATQEDCEIMQQAVESYIARDISTLDALHAILESSGKLKHKSITGTIEKLQMEYDRLYKTAQSLATKIKELKQSHPMNQVSMLSDSSLILKHEESLIKLIEDYDKVLTNYLNKIAPYENNRRFT